MLAVRSSRAARRSRSTTRGSTSTAQRRARGAPPGRGGAATVGGALPRGHRAVAAVDPDPRRERHDRCGSTARGRSCGASHSTQIPGYNICQDPQLEARGVAPYLRAAFAGEAVEIPAIRYDPNADAAGPLASRRAGALGPRIRLPGARRRGRSPRGRARPRGRDAPRPRRRADPRRGASGSGSRSRAARMNVWDWDLADRHRRVLGERARVLGHRRRHARPTSSP